MAGTLNKVMLIGNLGKDPEAMRFDNGGMIVKFPIATSESYRDREGNDVTRTEWHNIVVGRKGLAEVCEKYLRKGFKVYIEGKLRTRKWEDKEGNPRYTTEIQVDEMTMLTSKEDASRLESDSGQSYAQPQKPTPAAAIKADTPSPEEEDDLPF